MKKRNLAHTWTAGLLLLLGGIAMLMTYGDVAVHAQVQIVAPVLTKPVTLDGRFTADAWSDTVPVTLGLYTATTPSQRMNATIWAKHDSEWLYFMFRLSRFSGDSPDDACGIAYHWGPGQIGSKGKLSAFGTVNKRGTPQEFYGWNGTSWSRDLTGRRDTEGALVQSGNYAWCEFRKRLHSGGHDWNLSIGNTYGEGSGSLYAVAIDATNQKTYSERIALTLLSTTSTISITRSSSAASTGLVLPLLGQLDMTRLMQLAGGVGTGASFVIGWLFKTRKRRFMSHYLTSIDATFNEYSLDQEECKGRLGKMNEEISHMLKKGKIDEAQFTLLENKITQYMKKIVSDTRDTP